MAKRFTETDKWKDRWFVGLSGQHKLAWMYCCDQCDHAGILEIVEPVANIQIGFEIDWDEFVTASDGRIQQIEDGVYFIRAFVDFQYGELNEDNRVHKSVINRLQKKGLARGLEGASEGPSKALRTKTRIKTKTRTRTSDGEWRIPERLDCDRIRSLLGDFEQMRKDIRKPIRNLDNASKVLDKFDSVEHLAHAIEFCIANEYQGLKPDYRPSKTESKPQPAQYDFSQRPKSAKELYAERMARQAAEAGR